MNCAPRSARVFSALCSKELAHYFYSPAAYIVAVVFLLVCGYLFSAPLFMVNQASIRGFLETAPLLMTFVIPAITMRLFSEEFKSGTAELLFSLPVREWQLLLAKTLAALCVACAMLSLTAAYPIVIAFLGNIDGGAVLCSYAGLMLSALLLVCAGVFASACSRNQVVAFITSFLLCFALFLVGKMVPFMPPWLEGTASFLGLDAHLEAFARGVFDSRDALYFFSMSALFLFWAQLGLWQRRAGTADKAVVVRAAGGAALALCLFAAVNLLGAQARFRVDCTQGRIYSISPATKKLLASLEDPLPVTLYYSRELPPQINTMKAYLRDFLSEYAQASHGKLRVTVREIGADQQEAQQALKAGVIPVRFDIYSSDKYEQREGFFGLVLQYRDRQQLMPFINDISGLEYELSSRIKALLAGRKPSIGFVNSAGALNPYVMDPAFASKISSSYNIVLSDLKLLSVSSNTVQEMPALFLLGPETQLSEQEILALDSYLTAGGSVVLALNAKKVSLRNYSVEANSAGLEPWLKHHGLTVSTELVLDSQSQAIQVARQQGLFVFRNVVQYPPFVLASELDRDHPVTRTLDTLVLPYVSAVELVQGAQFKKLDTLVWSSKKSWRLPETAPLHDVDPFQDFGSGAKDRLPGPFRLAVAAQNSFVPYQPHKAGTGAVPACGRLVVIGSSRFVQPEYGMPDMNYIFLLNLIDWAAQDQALIDIRAKAAAFHPLRELSPSGKTAVRYTLFLLPPLLAILAGLAMWRGRIRRCKKAAFEFGGENAS